MSCGGEFRFNSFFAPKVVQLFKIVEEALSDLNRSIQGFAKANFIFAKANLKNALTFWGCVIQLS